MSQGSVDKLEDGIRTGQASVLKLRQIRCIVNGNAKLSIEQADGKQTGPPTIYRFIDGFNLGARVPSFVATHRYIWHVSGKASLYSAFAFADSSSRIDQQSSSASWMR